MNSSDGFWEMFADYMYGGTRLPRIPNIIGSLWEICGLQTGSAVADICCGRGYSSIELAMRGAKVSAVDFTPKFVAELNKAASVLKLDIVAYQGNAEEIRASGSMCAAMILWNSLGYQGLETDLEILANVRQSIHAGGSLVLELATLEELSKEPCKVTNRKIEDSKTFRRTRNLNVQTGKLTGIWEIFDEGEELVQTGYFEQLIYPKAEIVRMMDSTGWSYVTDSDTMSMNCEPTGTLFIARATSELGDKSCPDCRGVTHE